MLFTSGYTENAIVHNGRLDEGVELLSKPYTRDALARKIRLVLNAAHEARAGASAKPPADRLDGHLDGNGASPAQGRVLLVEDDVLIRMMTAEMLENIGLSVLEASSAGEALDILKDQLVDILLTDVGLPGISGIDLAARARSENPALRIVFATGNNSVPGLGERQDLAGAVLLQKPYTESGLAEALSASE